MQRRTMLIALANLVLALSLLCGRPVAAQSPAPSAEALAAARELLIAEHAGDQLKTLLPLIVQQLKPAIVH